MTYNSELYIHDMDRRAFDALNNFPRFIKLRESYISNYDEKTAKYNFLSSAIRLNEKQMPEIYNLLPPVCEMLEISVPELYYIKSDQMNAVTGGSTSPYIYVTSKLVDKVPLDLIRIVLAHECGHIACKHYLYHSMAVQLIGGIERSPLSAIPAVRRYLTPTLVKALLFWDRCSELSADRAAVLCDGGAEKTVDMLLKLHGYDDNINRDEFIKQAMDLKEFANDSKSNRLIEQMIIEGESHPRMATRVYECYEWARSDKFQGIISGTYFIANGGQDKPSTTEQKEVVAADITVEVNGQNREIIDIDEELNRVNRELERYTCNANSLDYALAVFSGIISGVIDATFVGQTKINRNDIAISHKHVNTFIQNYAEARGFDGTRLKDAIGFLEKEFKVPQDNVWKGAEISVSTKNHHLADLAHHPTPLGLVSAIIVQFLRVGTFVNKDGEWHFVSLKTAPSDVIKILAPAVVTGILKWLFYVSERKIEEENSVELPKAMHKLFQLAAFTPVITEVAKCADNWFGHLVSDMGGSKNTAGKGMGIPGVFISLLYELSALPGLKNSGLPALLNELYQNQKIDLRHELAICESAEKQFVPVAFNELLVRTLYFITHLSEEVAVHKDLKNIDWSNVIPFKNRTIDRMLTIASMTFTVADTTDAAVRAALESAGNWVLFSGKFVTRFNFVGAGRAAVAIVKEISNEKKEAQLIHEKLILTEAKTSFVVKQLEDYKAQLEERVSNYLAEDIEAFISGFDYMNQGIATGNSDMVIKGNVVIQRVLGRKPQFTNQAEFDELMASDVPLTL